MPIEQLNLLAQNPQALVNVDAQAQLKGLFDAFGTESAVVMDEVLSALREALASSLSTVFLIAFGILIAALIVNMFLKEVPLRKQHVIDEE